MKRKILAVALFLATILISASSYASSDRSKESKATVVHSVVDGRNTMTAYDKRGKWIYTIQQYNIDNLDKNIVDRVRSVYYDYGVTSIQEVEQPGMATVYVVHIENKKSIKLIRLTDDDLELVQDLQKS